MKRMRFGKQLVLISLIGLGLLTGLTFHTLASTNMQSARSPDHNSTAQTIQQPFWTKAAVTGVGISLIGLELWWFLWGKPKSREASVTDGVQDITVTVNGGYAPNQLVVTVNKPVRIHFHRTDPSRCLEEVRLPDFRIVKALPLNQTTTVEFTPTRTGTYEFTCGMNMVRGMVKVTNR